MWEKGAETRAAASQSRFGDVRTHALLRASTVAHVGCAQKSREAIRMSGMERWSSLELAILGRQIGVAVHCSSLVLYASRAITFVCVQGPSNFYHKKRE